MFDQWCKDWGIPAEAVADLRKRLVLEYLPEIKVDGRSEAAFQNRYRLDQARQGVLLWRNNNGAAKDERGNFFRYGLANDSKRVSDVIKSADLIGITPVTITQSMVGSTLGQFTSIEVKAPGWRYTGTPREKAQMNWAKLVESLGGKATFVTGEKE